MSIPSIPSGLAPQGSSPPQSAALARPGGTTRSPSGAGAASPTPTPAPAPALLAPAQADEQAIKAPSKEQVQQALEELREAVKPMAQDLQFEIDSDTGKTVVKIIDASTKDVIRQFPSEELLAIAQGLAKFEKLQGMLLQQKA